MFSMAQIKLHAKCSHYILRKRVPLLVAESNGKVNKKWKWFAKKWTNDEQNLLTSTTNLQSMTSIQN